jgi:hypothetical protein
MQGTNASEPVRLPRSNRSKCLGFRLVVSGRRAPLPHLGKVYREFWQGGGKCKDQATRNSIHKFGKATRVGLLRSASGSHNAVAGSRTGQVRVIDSLEPTKTRHSALSSETAMPSRQLELEDAVRNVQESSCIGSSSRV